MQSDEAVWHVLRHNHCSYMSKIETGVFCRNEYNVSGVCNRSSCPLANSRYATIRDPGEKGVFYLYMKTVERAHAPNQLWERVKLPLNYLKALEVIDKQLMYWPKLLVHKTKQRLTKMCQMRIRMRKLALRTREVIKTVSRKEVKIEGRKEDKAVTAAKIEQSIEKELLERLMIGVYGKIYPVVKTPHNENEEEKEGEKEYVEGDYETEEEDDIEDFGRFDTNESYEYEISDEADMVAFDRRRARNEFEKGELDTQSNKNCKILVEVEHVELDERTKAIH